LYKREFLNDIEYNKWKNYDITFTRTAAVVRVISFITNFNFSKLLYCKLLEFSFFSAVLSSPEKLKNFNLLSLYNICFSYLLLIVSAIYSAYIDEDKSSLLFSDMDVLAVHMFCIVLMICETKKESSFFDSKNYLPE
jgi:hypothetical protein